MRKIEVVDYNPEWPVAFEQEREQILPIAPGLIIEVHHIGSTSVPELAAKPIIDMLLEVKEIAALDAHNAAFEALGYEALGEFGILGRRYFRKGGDDRTHQIHAFESGSDGWLRHIAFRDYLRAHPEVREAYAAVKREAAAQCNHDIYAYMDHKDAFVKAAEQDALRWYAQQS